MLSSQDFSTLLLAAMTKVGHLFSELQGGLFDTFHLLWCCSDAVWVHFTMMQFTVIRVTGIRLAVLL